MNWKAPLECWELAEDQVLLKLADALLVCLRAGIVSSGEDGKSISDSVRLAGSKIACRGVGAVRSTER